MRITTLKEYRRIKLSYDEHGSYFGFSREEITIALNKFEREHILSPVAYNKVTVYPYGGKVKYSGVEFVSPKINTQHINYESHRVLSDYNGVSFKVRGNVEEACTYQALLDKCKELVINIEQKTANDDKDLPPTSHIACLVATTRFINGLRKHHYFIPFGITKYDDEETTKTT